MRNNEFSKKRGWIIAVLFFFFLLVAAIFIIPWGETWQVLLISDVGLIGFAFFLSIPHQILVSASYFFVFKQQNVQIDFWVLFKINLILVFYDVVLPSTFLVSGLRWYRYNQYSNNPDQTLTSIAYIKLFNIFLTLLTSIGFILVFNTTSLQGYSFEIFLLIITVGLILFFAPRIGKHILSKIPLPNELQNSHRALSILYSYLHRLICAIADFRNINLKTLLVLIVLGMTTQGIQYYSYIMFAESVGIQLSFSQLGAIRAVILLVANIPFNFSVGISLREVTLVSLLVTIGVPLEQAVAMSIVVLSKSFFYAIFGGFIEAVQLIVRKRTTESY